MNRRIVFRIGVNLGDILIDSDDVFGDGASCLKASGHVYGHTLVRKQLACSLASGTRLLLFPINPSDLIVGPCRQ